MPTLIIRWGPRVERDETGCFKRNLFFSSKRHTTFLPAIVLGTKRHEEVREMFNAFDVDGGGQLDFNEFIAKLRPPLSESRVAVIKKAFGKADKSGDGILTVADLKGIYNARKHPKYLNGEWEEKQVFEEFLKSFEPDNKEKDGKVTWDEFLTYYSGVSHSIDNDGYFDLMMRNSWKI